MVVPFSARPRTSFLKRRRCNVPEDRRCILNRPKLDGLFAPHLDLAKLLGFELNLITVVEDLPSRDN